MKILVTGGTGKLGSELKKVFKNALFPTRKELDILKPVQVKKYLEKTSPDLIIHTAGITDIRLCEKNKKLAWDTNYLGTKNLINATQSLIKKPYFIYISTACVFDGVNSPFIETDIPNPKNFYSLTKLLGEIVVSNSNLSKTLIIRTNFVSRSPWPYEKAFTDRFGTYLFTNDVATGISELIQAKKTGIVHLTGNKKMSMYELAKIVSPNVKPMTLNDYNGPTLTIDMSLKTNNWKTYKISKYP